MDRDPAAVLQAAIRGVVDRLPDPVKEDRHDALEEFQLAKHFVGPKTGFFFGTGPKGTGYYPDPTVPRRAPDVPGKADRQTVDPGELLREAEEQAGIDEVQLLDAKSLKRHVAGFERKYKENLEMRMKYTDQPEKFMESEVDLDEEVQRLLAVAGSPELYPEFVKLGAVQNLMALLSHENTDIAADVIELFQQLTDADVIEDSEEEAAILVESMIEHNGIELLVHRLTSLAETTDDERKAVFNTLSIFENMVEVKPEVAEMVLDRSKLLKWMLGRLRPREFDSNKQYTAELLAILLQSSQKNQQRLADANGIDVLLQAIAPYKNRNPGSIDEEEFLENLFNALCACLISAETRALFLKAEGIELMLLILKQKRVARDGALKALDFATTRSPVNCERFVDQFGLKTVFSIFMGKSKVKRRKGEDADEAESEERALSTIANLFQGLARGSRRDRLAAKFVENEFEKCDRLMELYTRYHHRVQAAEAELEQRGGADEELSEEDRLLARMDQGLYSLQQCALIVGHLWFVGDLGVRKRILQLLHQKGLTLADVRGILKELLRSIGDNDSAAEAEREQNRVRRMLAALGHEETAEEAPPAPPSPEFTVPPSGNGAVEAKEPVQAEPTANGSAEEVQPEAVLPVSQEPTQDANPPTAKPHKESKQESKSRPDSRPSRDKASESSKHHDDEERRKDRKRREDDDRHHEGKHRHKEEKRHREDRDSKKEKRRREDDDHRERKRDRHR